MDEAELLELLPREAIIELFKQRIVLTEEEFANALKEAISEFYGKVLRENSTNSELPNSIRGINSSRSKPRKSIGEYSMSPGAVVMRRLRAENTDYRLRQARQARDAHVLRYATDSEFREKKLAYAKEYYKKRKKEAMKNEQEVHSHADQ